MRSKVYLILILLISMSCKEASETKFAKDGISLTCPTGWKITEEENIENQGYYLSIEKDGLTSSGLFTLSWLSNRLDLYEWIDIYKEQLSSNIVYRNSNLTFGEPFESEFNNISSVAVKFNVSILGLKHEGIIHVFYGNDKTISILKQEAIEDKIKNEKGFEMIEKSLRIE